MSYPVFNKRAAIKAMVSEYEDAFENGLFSMTRLAENYAWSVEGGDIWLRDSDHEIWHAAYLAAQMVERNLGIQLLD